MQTTEFMTDLVIEMRETTENSDIAGQGYGRAVPYGVDTQIGNIRESFAANAFPIESVVGKPLAYRHGEPIGVITAAENKPDGLYIDFNIANTMQGRDAATLIRTGSAKGLSVGFAPTKSVWNRAKTTVQHLAANLAEVSITHMPAYATAGVSAIREEEMSVETVEVEAAPAVTADIEAREAIASVREQLAAVEARSFIAPVQVHDLAKYRSFGEYSKAVYAGEIESRTLTDQVTDNNPGVMPPIFMQDVKRIVDLGRPAITAMGTESAGTSGMEFNWPYFDGDIATIVEEQVDEKDEVNSVRIDIEKGTASLKTYAAGSDISYQLLQRSSPSYVDAHNRIMLNSYAYITNKVFGDALEARTCAGSDLAYNIANDTDGQVFRGVVFEGSVLVETETGLPASVVLAGSSLFKKFGEWSTFNPSVYTVQNVSGVATASSLVVNVSGLPVIHVRTLPANRAIITNTTTASWIEDGPRLATAENVAQLGRDIAIYGFGTTAIFNPCGIVRV
jgi:HK97 family phage prohead protease